ncbi:MAG TPA: FxDxF family PEP-CTERM protein [Steroidobacteraceae bacterium]|nr:FxDxF family PEP-CTERM protein [Steroidobacteraceae bacterium]
MLAPVKFTIGATTLAVCFAVGTAGAATLYVGDTVTASGSGASQTYTVTSDENPSNGTLVPTSTYSLSGNSFNEGTSPTTSADFSAAATGNSSGGPWNFQDDYYFSLNPGAEVQAAVISNSESNVQDLQVRLIYAAGNTVSAGDPVLGPPAGGTLLNAWQSLNLGGGSIDLTMPATVGPGSYIMQIRGEAVGNEAASYGGTMSLTPVPLPGAFALLLSGLGLAFLLLRRRGGGFPVTA